MQTVHTVKKFYCFRVLLLILVTVQYSLIWFSLVKEMLHKWLSASSDTSLNSNYGNQKSCEIWLIWVQIAGLLIISFQALGKVLWFSFWATNNPPSEKKNLNTPIYSPISSCNKYLLSFYFRSDLLWATIENLESESAETCYCHPCFLTSHVTVKQHNRYDLNRHQLTLPFYF